MRWQRMACLRSPATWELRSDRSGVLRKTGYADIKPEEDTTSGCSVAYSRKRPMRGLSAPPDEFPHHLVIGSESAGRPQGDCCDFCLPRTSACLSNTTFQKKPFWNDT